MSPDTYLIALFGFIMALVCLALAFSAYRRTGEFLSPWILFLGMAAVDIYLPAALFPSGELLAQPYWIPASSHAAIGPAIALFTVSVALFAFGYLAGCHLVPGRLRPSRLVAIELFSPNRFSPRRAIVVFVIALVIYLSRAMGDVLVAGSLPNYLSQLLTNRLQFQTQSMDAKPALQVLLTQLQIYMLPVLFVTIGALFSHRAGHRLMRGLVFPCIGLLLAASLFYRGTILLYIVGFVLIETERRRDSLFMSIATLVEHGRRRTTTNLMLAALLGLALFVLYGWARNYLTLQQYTTHYSLFEALVIELRRFILGEGLTGLSAILDYYPREHGFMQGRTILDMLLLPVPRWIWESKPSWYGITEITLAMGWPGSTQNAVTMPGELYANFGYPGILLMYCYGIAFGLFHRVRHGLRSRYVYAFILLPMMLPTFWMSFTGFVNQLVPVPLTLLALWYMFPMHRNPSPTGP